MFVNSIIKLDLFLGVEGESVPKELANGGSDLDVHVIERFMLVLVWLLLVENSCQGVESTCNLEDGSHLVLQELLWAAVVGEAPVADDVQPLLDLALLVEHVVD